MPETIEAKELQIASIFNDAYRFEVPDYQRPYAWTTEQTGELLDDLLHAMGQGEEISETSPYFLGSIVIIKKGLDRLAQIVDGQQRITTMTILFCVLRELASEDKQTAFDRYVHVEDKPLEGIEGHFRLTVRKLDRDFFENNIQKMGNLTDFLSNTPSTNLTDSRQRMYENANYLWQKLSKIEEEQRYTLAMFLIQRCYLVVVSTSDQNSAYRIFSVMNDRGMDLSPTDILKAEIIGAMEDKNNVRSRYTKKWETIEENLGRDGFRDLFAHIRMTYMKNKLRGTLQQEFKDNVLKSANRESFIDEELKPYADTYEIVTRPSYEDAPDAENVNVILRHLNELDNFDWIPPAMAFLKRHSNFSEEPIRFVSDLERLAYGMFIIRANINQRIRRYADVLRAIEGEKKLFEDSSPLQLSSTEKSEIMSALNGQVYSQLRVRRPLLLRLNSLLADEVVHHDYRTITIEHVLPQNPRRGSKWLKMFPDENERAKWTGRLANLVLLSRRKNSQAQNFDFDRKKKEYFQRGGVPTFALTVQVVNETEWTPEVLRKRQKRLINALQKEWRLK